MATAAVPMPSSSSSSSSATTPPPSAGSSNAAPATRNGLPINPAPLSAVQEQQVRDLYYKRVRQHCADEVREFATCALQHTYTATIFCRQPQLVMNKCMVKYATQAEFDRSREEWFRGKEARKVEREEKERKREEAKKKHAEWWGLDEHGRRKFDQEKKKS